MAKTVKKAAGKPGSKKTDFLFEGKRLEEVKETEIPKPRLQEFYINNVVPNLMKRFNYSNPMQVPKLEKIVLNMGDRKSVV